MHKLARVFCQGGLSGTKCPEGFLAVGFQIISVPYDRIDSRDMTYILRTGNILLKRTNITRKQPVNVYLNY